MRLILRALARMLNQRGALAYTERESADGGRSRRLLVIIESRAAR